MSYRYIVVWYNPNKNLYFYKKVWGYYTNYSIGYKNQYNHEVILIIDIFDLKKSRVAIKNRIIDKLISRLEKLK